MLQRLQTPKLQQGVTLVTVLLLILVITIGAGGMVQVYQTQTKREKEQQLLFAGDQIRRAITSYYNTIPRGGVRQLPLSLEVLLEDQRTAPATHHLRQIYADPMTGKPNWALVQGAGGVIGVHSTSKDQPLKIANFPLAYKSFEGTSSYSQWIFQLPVTSSQATTPRPKPGSP